MKTLDKSHWTLLENFAIFQRAQQCVEEIRNYVRDVLQDVASEQPHRDDPAIEFNFDKGGWIQADAFPHDLISVGIENFDLADVLGCDGAKGTRAYVYSCLINEADGGAENPALALGLRQLSPPPGFALAPSQEHGYIFVKNLGAPTIETVCSLPKFERHFADPLNELADWLKRNKETIEALGQTSSQ